MPPSEYSCAAVEIDLRAGDFKGRQRHGQRRASPASQARSRAAQAAEVDAVADAAGQDQGLARGEAQPGLAGGHHRDEAADEDVCRPSRAPTAGPRRRSPRGRGRPRSPRAAAAAGRGPRRPARRARAAAGRPAFSSAKHPCLTLGLDQAARLAGRRDGRAPSGPPPDAGADRCRGTWSRPSPGCAPPLPPDARRICFSRIRRWTISARTWACGSSTAGPCAGMIDLVVAAEQQIEALHIGGHVAVGRRDHGRRPAHDMVAGEQGAGPLQREAEMVGGVARRRHRAQRPIRRRRAPRRRPAPGRADSRNRRRRRRAGRHPRAPAARSRRSARRWPPRAAGSPGCGRDGCGCRGSRRSARLRWRRGSRRHARAGPGRDRSPRPRRRRRYRSGCRYR